MADVCVNIITVKIVNETYTQNRGLNGSAHCNSLEVTERKPKLVLCSIMHTH